MCLDPTRLENKAHSEGCRTFTTHKACFSATDINKISFYIHQGLRSAASCHGFTDDVKFIHFMIGCLQLYFPS